MVLIVAKCIVNNSDYQKFKKEQEVLIVAKCIVNQKILFFECNDIDVLIVAKCIVNVEEEDDGEEAENEY